MHQQMQASACHRVRMFSHIQRDVWEKFLPYQLIQTKEHILCYVEFVNAQLYLFKTWFQLRAITLLFGDCLGARVLIFRWGGWLVGV